MRRLSLRISQLGAVLVALALAATVALTLPGVARADNVNSPKIEGRLAKLANGKDKNAEVAIILRGPDSNKLFRKYAKNGKQLALVSGVATTVKVKDLDKIAADSEVSYVLADPPVASTGTVDYKNLKSIFPITDRAQHAWDAGFDGTGVGVAVIDSGIAPVADFGNRLTQVTMPGQPWVTADLYGHGSFVAGLLAGKSTDGKYIGIAPGASLYALDVNNPAGVRSSDVINALQWVYENAHAYNIRVANLSLGENTPSSYRESMLDLAVERVWAAGVAVVVSSGNGGPGKIDFAPANDPLAIVVGASDPNGTRDIGDDTVASFTGSGVTVDGFARPDLIAPGRLVPSVLAPGTTLDLNAPVANKIGQQGYATMSGTSFSAPQVAGAAALLFQKHPEWSPDQIKGALVQTARPLTNGSQRTLDVAESLNVANSGLANQGVMALVCAPGAACLPDTGLSTLSSSWNSSSWNSSSWNSSSWNSSSWNSSSWNSSSWNSSSWNSSSWNSSSWNSSSWNSATWDDPADVSEEPVPTDLGAE